MEKTCTKCGKTKSVEEFAKAGSGTFGRRGDCKQCRCSYNKNWYASLDSERKVSRRGDPSAKAAYQREYMRRTKVARRECQRKWNAENIDAVRACLRGVMRRKRATAKGRLEANVSRALHRVLRGGKAGAPSFVLLGYSSEALMAHLERQFTKGMTWDNYGQWHVDHIVPLSTFSYQTADDEGFRQAWALANLQPLWAIANIVKGAKRVLLV